MTPVDAELAGYAETRFSYQVGVDGTAWALTERVRPAFSVSPAERVTAEVVVEAALAQGRDGTAEMRDTILASDLGPVIEEGGCTTYERGAELGSTAGYLSVERLHLDYNTPHVDLKLGRQPLRWGSGLAFHPTDLYAEVLLSEPWREARGVNAVRADVPLGASQITGVVAVDDDLSGLWQEEMEAPLTSGAVKATLRAVGTDFSAVGQVKSDGDWFAGADLRGTLGVGWWVEGGWYGDAAAPEVVVGVDYSFLVFNRFYVAAEYRYDGTGAAPEDYDFSTRVSGGAAPFSCPFLAESDADPRSTLGRHYVDQLTSVNFTEDVGLTNALIFNLEDGSGLVVPDVFVNVGQRWAIHAGAQIFVGKEGGEFRPSDDQLVYAIGAAQADLSGLFPDATLNGWVRYSF